MRRPLMLKAIRNSTRVKARFLLGRFLINVILQTIARHKSLDGPGAREIGIGPVQRDRYLLHIYIVRIDKIDIVDAHPSVISQAGTIGLANGIVGHAESKRNEAVAVDL